jgi:cysteine-rich repeat protein
VPTCGDGILAGKEECDDANAAGGDGCSARRESPSWADGSFRGCARSLVTKSMISLVRDRFAHNKRWAATHKLAS